VAISASTSKKKHETGGTKKFGWRADTVFGLRPPVSILYLQPSLVILNASVLPGLKIEEHSLSTFRTMIRKAGIDPAEKLAAAGHVKEAELHHFV